ncbi:MAG: OmpA family protein [Planctomycetes bacterium]|nr:OmpA family protein [Planctomycetota bacterium]
MRKIQNVVVCVTGFIAAVSAGCVSLDDHRQLQMAHRTLEAEKSQLEQELYDLRNNNSSLQTRLTSTERNINSKERLASNLQAENNRLQAAVGSAQRTVEELARQNVLQDPIIIESARLPAQLDSALQAFAAKYPGSVTYDAKNGLVKWTSDLVFTLGSDVVKNSAKTSLDGFANIVQSPAANGFDVLVVGHTDNRPIKRAETRKNHPTNWHLSTHRSISVSNVLRDRGIPAGRIGVMGYGETRPIASNKTETGRSQNRRVEIYLLPQGSLGSAVAGQSQGTGQDQGVASRRVKKRDMTK